MSGTLSSPGIGSKLDVNSIVKQLTAVESQPIEVLANQQQVVSAKLSSIGLLKNFVGNLRDAAARLADPTLWQSTTATSSNEAVATVTATAAAHGTPTGTYRLSVQRLAQPQTLVSTPSSDAHADLGAGHLTIALGTWLPQAGGFTPQAGRSAVTIDLPASPSGLDAVRDRINAANAGVTASLLHDATGVRLVVRSASTGAENGVRITADGDPPGTPPPPGLAGLAYDPPSGAVAMSSAQPAVDASATLNGVPVASASNVLDGAVAGVAITLRQVSDSTTTVTVSTDTATMKKALGDFASAYNDAAGYIATQTAYDKAAGKAQPLQGDAATLQLQRQMRTALQAVSAASPALPTLLDVGLHLDASHQLVLDPAKATQALAHPAAVATAFTHVGGGDAASDGFGVRFEKLAATALEPDGLLAQRSQALSATVRRSQKQQAQMTERVNQYQARLLKQYTALDGRMSTLNGQAAYVTQEVNLLSKSRTG